MIAIFLNAMNQRRFDAFADRMMSVISFNYMIGSLLFCMGSIAFLPNVGCGPEMVALGAWMFIIGSAFFVIGSVMSFSRTYYMLRDSAKDDSDSQEEDRITLASERVLMAKGARKGVTTDASVNSGVARVDC